MKTPPNKILRTRKLAISTETIALLTPFQLFKVAGGNARSQLKTALNLLCDSCRLRNSVEVLADVRDEELLSRWRQGSTEAGQILFERHYEVVRRYFRNKVPAADTRDLVQERFLASLQACEWFRGHSTFRTYLLGIAHHSRSPSYWTNRSDHGSGSRTYRNTHDVPDHRRELAVMQPIGTYRDKHRNKLVPSDPEHGSATSNTW